jgi:hypothetical protein
MNQNDHMQIPLPKVAWTTETVHLFLRATANELNRQLAQVHLSETPATLESLTLTQLVVLLAAQRQLGHRA